MLIVRIIRIYAADNASRLNNVNYVKESVPLSHITGFMTIFEC